MNGIANALERTEMVALAVLKVVTIVCFVCLTLLITANVVVRFVPVVSLHWFDEIIEMLYAYLVFYGSAAVWISREHFSVGDWIGATILKEASAHRIYRFLLEVLVLVFMMIFTWYSFRLFMLAQDVTNVFAIPKKVLYSCLPVSGAVMIVSSVRFLLAETAAGFKPKQMETGGAKS